MRVLLPILLLAACSAHPDQEACVARGPIAPDAGQVRYATMVLRQDGAPCSNAVAVAAGGTPAVLHAPAHGRVTVVPQGDAWLVTYTRGEPRPPAPPSAAQAKVTSATAAPAAAARVAATTPSPALAPPTASPTQAEPQTTAQVPPPAGPAEQAQAAAAETTTYLGGDWFAVADAERRRIVAVDVSIIP